MFHAGLPLSGGFVGVDVFFVISGFVITAMLMREWDRTGTVSLTAFYLRRAKRLTPALALVVAVTAVVSSLFLSPFDQQEQAAQTGLGALALVANWVIAAQTGDYFGPGADSNPLLHTWSLSVEEQFYLAFPIALLVAWRAGRRFRRPHVAAFALVALVGLASLAMLRGAALGIPCGLLDPRVLLPVQPRLGVRSGGRARGRGAARSAQPHDWGPRRARWVSCSWPCRSP